MKTIQIFDPALCCSTGVCGVEVDQALVSFSADVDWAKQNGAQIERFNLAQQPMAFAENATVKGFLERSGQEGAAVDPRRWRNGAGWPLSEPRRTGALGGRHGSGDRSEAERMLRRQPQLLNFQRTRHEISRTAAAFPLLHRQGRRRQNVDRLRDGDPARRSRAPRAAGQHRSGLECRARCSASISATRSRPFPPCRGFSRWKSTRRRRRKPIATASSAPCAAHFPTPWSRASRNSSPEPARRKSPPSMNSPRC